MTNMRYGLVGLQSTRTKYKREIESAFQIFLSETNEPKENET